jgi:RecJ-like exonuclease
MGETITETVVIHPSEGDDKLNILNEQAKTAVKEAVGKMGDKYADPWVEKPEPAPNQPIKMCPKCQGHGGVPGNKCERCEGTGREDKQSNI